ncbi:hypothetical protein [Streptomyces venezuelae]|uniref:hypothetical protein n=1 Tax=Streptomyces venezuelae TaxID=54571 RepID=UPI00343CCF19
MHEPIITVAVWNLSTGCAADDIRARTALDILARYKPDIYLQQEDPSTSGDAIQRKGETEDRLAMRGFSATPNPVGGANITASVYIRTDTFPAAQFVPVAKPWSLHPSQVRVHLGDCPRPLNLLSLNLCAYDSDLRRTEAAWLTTLAHPGMVTLAAGSMNSYPSRPAENELPSWEEGHDRAFWVQRTFVDPAGQRRNDTRPDATLRDSGFVDLAQYADQTLHQPHALYPTAGFHMPRDGGPQRTDRVYGAGGLEEAVIGVEVICGDALSASRQALLLVRLSRETLARILTRPRAPAW